MVIMYVKRPWAPELVAGWACGERGRPAAIRTSFGPNVELMPVVVAELLAVRLTKARNDSVANAGRHASPRGKPARNVSFGHNL